jgi:aldehyde dehydrogenase (NAD+)
MDVKTSYDSLFIAGRWMPSSDGGVTDVVNPATGGVVGTVPAGTVADLHAAVGAARTAFDDGPWPRMSQRERSALLHRFADILESWRGAVAPAIRQEAGALTSLIDGVHFGIGPTRFRYAADLAVRRQDEITPLQVGPGSVLGATAVVHEPVGVVGAITPFNFPLFLNLSKLGPALAVGNTVVLKPSPLTPLEGLVLGAVAEEAGLPPGVLNVVTGGGEVGEALVDDPRTDLVSFTGSDTTGSQVMSIAARSLKRVVLELGGKSALIVRDDADAGAAAAAAFASFTLHAGQGCVLLTRHIVHRSMAQDFVAALSERAAATVVGDPADPATTMGPLISEQQRARVAGFVDGGVADGGRIAFGGTAPDRDGFFYTPTVIEGLRPDARAVREEIFGPVAVVLPFDDDEQAVAIANDTHFGLSGAIISRDAGRAWEMARRLRTGAVRINGGGTALDLDAPITGWGRSGIGAEHGMPGLLEFTQPKSIAFRVG